MTNAWGEQPAATFAYTCPRCRVARNMVQMAKWQVVPDGDEDFEPFEWTVASCEVCSSPLLLQADADIERGRGYLPPKQVYPERGRDLTQDVPQIIRRAFEEAQVCIEAQAYVASTMMSRRALQAIVNHYGHEKRSLFNALDQMRQEGKLDSRLAEWADAVRLVGNEGAHDVDAETDWFEANEVLAFLEALIDYLFVFQGRYDRFVRLREARKNRARGMSHVELVERWQEHHSAGVTHSEEAAGENVAVNDVVAAEGPGNVAGYESTNDFTSQ